MRTVPPRSEVVASSVLAFAVACASHEVLGHGAACLAEGGVISLLSSVYFRCSGGGVVADLGGPAGNALVGLVCVGLLRGRLWKPAAQMTLMLCLAFNFLWLAGVLIWSSVAGQSDFAFAVRELGQGGRVARILLAPAGVALALVTLRWVELPRSVVRTAYVAAGVASCASALLYAGPIAPALREAALEGFGSMAWLLLVPASAVPIGGPAVATSEADGRLLFPLAALAVVGLLVLGRGYGQVSDTVIRLKATDRPHAAARVERHAPWH